MKKQFLNLMACAAFFAPTSGFCMEMDPQELVPGNSKIKLDTKNPFSEANKETALRIYRGAYQAFKKEEIIEKDIVIFSADAEKQIEEKKSALSDLMEEHAGYKFCVKWVEYGDYSGRDFYKVHSKYLPSGKLVQAPLLDVRKEELQGEIRKLTLKHTIDESYFPRLNFLLCRTLEELKKDAQAYYNTFGASCSPLINKEELQSITEGAEKLCNLSSKSLENIYGERYKEGIISLYRFSQNLSCETSDSNSMIDQIKTAGKNLFDQTLTDDFFYKTDIIKINALILLDGFKFFSNPESESLKLTPSNEEVENKLKKLTDTLQKIPADVLEKIIDKSDHEDFLKFF